jgi:hypothetical protein
MLLSLARISGQQNFPRVTRHAAIFGSKCRSLEGSDNNPKVRSQSAPKKKRTPDLKGSKEKTNMPQWSLADTRRIYTTN